MATKRRRPESSEGGGEERACATPERAEERAPSAKEDARPDKRRRVAVENKSKCEAASSIEKATEKATEKAAEEKKRPAKCVVSTPARVKRARAASPAPSASSVASPPAKLRRTSSLSGAEGEFEEKARVPQRVRVPSLDGDDIPKENREEGLPPACRNLAAELRLEDARTRPRDSEEVKRQVLLRSLQVTPPPSARMLDKKNPPPPPPRPKRRRFSRPGANGALTGGVTYARSYPRLALSPLVDSPPGSPRLPASPQRVFRSLADDFMAVQDTPQQTHRVRPAPQMARRSARRGARRSIDTPTSTMVLRSRQLNHNTQPSMSKPENAREREQREFHERERRGT